MLSNAYFLAKFRLDTAENEPAKNLQKFANFADPNPLTDEGRLQPVDVLGGTRGRRGRRPGGERGDAAQPRAQLELDPAVALTRHLQFEIRMFHNFEVCSMFNFAEWF